MSNIVFVTLCFGEQCRDSTMHLLNDLRNLDHTVYLYTNINFDIKKYQFDNVKLINVNKQDWDCFEKYHAIKHALKDNNNKYVYYIDCDTRFFNFRTQKYCAIKFCELLDAINFDILVSWFVSTVSPQLEKPDPWENKDIRNFKYGYPEFIKYLKEKIPNYEKEIEKDFPLEGICIYKNNNKVISFLEDMIKTQRVLIKTEEKYNRKLKAQSSGFCIPLMASVNNINIIKSPITYHFFKANFLREVFPFNFIICREEKIFKD